MDNTHITVERSHCLSLLEQQNRHGRGPNIILDETWARAGVITGVGKGLILDETESSPILGSRPGPSAFIFILYKRSGALTGL